MQQVQLPLPPDPHEEAQQDYFQFLENVAKIGGPSPDDTDEIREAKSKAIRDLVSQFTPEQMDRYEFYRRSKVPQKPVKMLMQALCQDANGASVGERPPIILAGITKVYLGELVELALRIMVERHEAGPILPHHLAEARRRAKTMGLMPWLPQPGSNHSIVRRWR